MNASSTTTYTPTPAVSTGIVAHGFMAIGMHMAENPLPRPLQVYLPDGRPGHDRFQIHVMEYDVDAWADSIEVDDVETRPQVGPDFPDGCPRYARHHLGRLPNSGVRIDVFCLVAYGHRLQAVQS